MPQRIRSGPQAVPTASRVHRELTPMPKRHRSARPERSAIKDVDWKDFRDHLATADQEGRRQWLYPAASRTGGSTAPAPG